MMVTLAVGCTSSQPASDAGTQQSPEWFTERAQESRLDFVHFNGMSGKFYQPEIMAPGVALFDYDNDGDLDVYLVQGRMLGSGKPLIKPPTTPDLKIGPTYAPDDPLADRLYRNDLQTRP